MKSSTIPMLYTFFSLVLLIDIFLCTRWSRMLGVRYTGSCICVTSLLYPEPSNLTLVLVENRLLNCMGRKILHP